MAARGQLQFFLWTQKLLKLNFRNYSNSTITFPTIWRCAGDFFKVLLKFKMAATGQLHFFCGRKNLKSEIIQILLSHSLPCGDVQGIFSSCYWNSKWLPRINFNFFVGAKTLKLKVRNYSNSTITPPTIWRRFYWNSKWPQWINFIIFCWRKN